jgi:hypothetical protein
MDKIVGNMHDLVKSLQSDKAKEKERIAALKRFEFGKNPNYAQSVWIGFREAVIFFPTYLVRGMKAPLLLFAQAVFQSLGFLLAAVVGAPTLIVMGLFGHMKPKPKAKS